MSTQLLSAFNPKSSYASHGSYSLLPFDFLRLDEYRVLVTSMAGEFAVLPCDIFGELCSGSLSRESSYYRELLARHLVMEKKDSSALEFLNVKVQNKIRSTAEFTGLHIFVVTLRCDHSCQYCQVSRQNANAGSFICPGIMLIKHCIGCSRLRTST